MSSYFCMDQPFCLYQLTELHYCQPPCTNALLQCMLVVEPNVWTLLTTCRQQSTLDRTVEHMSVARHNQGVVLYTGQLHLAKRSLISISHKNIKQMFVLRNKCLQLQRKLYYLVDITIALLFNSLYRTPEIAGQIARCWH